MSKLLDYIAEGICFDLGVKSILPVIGYVGIYYESPSIFFIWTTLTYAVIVAYVMNLVKNSKGRYTTTLFFGKRVLCSNDIRVSNKYVSRISSFLVDVANALMLSHLLWMVTSDTAINYYGDTIPGVTLSILVVMLVAYAVLIVKYIPYYFKEVS